MRNKKGFVILLISILLLVGFGIYSGVCKRNTTLLKASEREYKIIQVKGENKLVTGEADYVDEEMYRVIKETIDHIDFDVDFQPGDAENIELLKAQFKKFLEGEATVRIKRTGEEVYIYDLGKFRTDIELGEFDIRGYSYYFFDINGDEKPELCVTDKARFTYVFQYDEADNQVTLWKEYVSDTIFFMGTRKLGFGGWSGDGFISLDKDGGFEYCIWFKAVGGSAYLINGDGYGYFISLPEYVELSDDGKAQAVYDKADETYYFRVTKEQYMELTEKYFRACKDVSAAIKDVTYTYEELFETTYELTDEEKLSLEKKSDFYEGTVQYSKITVNYPQINGSINSEIVENTNALIKQAAFSVWGNTYEEAAAQLEAWQKDSYQEETVIDYEVIHFSHDYMSVIFSVFSVTGGPSYFGNYPVSVDLNKGEYIGLYDITSKEQVIDAVKDGKFKVYIGTYSEVDEEDFHNPEVIDLLAEELEDSLGEPPAEGFDRFSGWNIGIDEEDIYIRIHLSDIAFHDYVILSIPLDEVTK